MALMTMDELSQIHFTLDELKEMTGNFMRLRLIAKGKNGLVYHAYGRNYNSSGQCQSVVKIFDMGVVQDSLDVFEAQVSVVYKLDHENVLQLIGYCSEQGNRALVYEYATQGSLYDVLYGRKGIEDAKAGPVLTWAQRTEIAYGAAKGLEYLHETVDPPIVHGDVRSCNVLLSNDFRPQISDIDLKMVLPNDRSHGAPRACSTGALGSYSRNGPEYGPTGEVTKKGDVYSFGVVLLELLTGRKPVDKTLPEEQQDLVTWAIPFLSDDKVEQIVDPKLNGDFPPKAVAKVAALAKLCIQDEPDFRPNMSIMVKALESPQVVPEDDPNNEALREIAVKAYTMEELNEATKNFSHMSLIAKTPYAKVYRTHYSYNFGNLFAVKKLDMSVAQDSDADFIAQLSRVSTLKHDYLTELSGYCLEENNRILVYEFATMGSLHDVLYGRTQVYGSIPGPYLSWSQRANIAYWAAKGLRYLHETVEPPVVHGGIRSSNVYLFDSLIPDTYFSKIADFNLTNALLGEDLTENRTKKSDIYGFGVVLLELLTGRKAIDDTLPEDQQDLVTWATPYLSAEGVEQIIDPKFDGDYSLEDVAKVVEVARLCIQDEPDLRPDMSTVVKALGTAVYVPL